MYRSEPYNLKWALYVFQVSRFRAPSCRMRSPTRRGIAHDRAASAVEPPDAGAASG